jgi:dynein heavy chain
MLTQVDELQTTLDELLNTLLMMKQSPFLGSLRKKTEEIEKKLIGIQDLLGEWLKCQRTWVYLNPIFASEDLKKKMPVEKKLFDGVDSNWQSIMAGVAATPRCSRTSTGKRPKSS